MNPKQPRKSGLWFATTLATVLCLSLSMTACRSTSTLQTPVSPPASSMVKCPPMVGPEDDSQDAQSDALAGLVDLYVACALRHNTLVDWNNHGK